MPQPRQRAAMVACALSLAATAAHATHKPTKNNIASIYFHDRHVACGGRFDPRALTAAHRSLPCGSVVEVRRAGHAVAVTINDRGPYVRGRVIDLTPAAARAIGLSSSRGLARVSLAFPIPTDRPKEVMPTDRTNPEFDRQPQSRRLEAGAVKPVDEVTASRRHRRHHYRYARRWARQALALASDGLPIPRPSAELVVAHPAGCPGHAFCGCGVSIKVFGHPVRELYLARAWHRFPRAMPGPGKVAVFGSHHVAYILAAYGDGTADLYDPNSGGHQTRIHRRDISRATIVDPRGGA